MTSSVICAPRCAGRPSPATAEATNGVTGPVQGAGVPRPGSCPGDRRLRPQRAPPRRGVNQAEIIKDPNPVLRSRKQPRSTTRGDICHSRQS